MASARRPNYQHLQAELDEIMTRLQGGDVDVDEALQLYERGLSVIKELERYLTGAENRVRKIKAKFGQSQK